MRHCAGRSARFLTARQQFAISKGGAGVRPQCIRGLKVDKRAKGIGRKIAGLALAVVCLGVVLLLMRIPMFVDYSEVETIGAETYIGWPIPWKTSAPGGGGFLFGIVGIIVPLLNWMIFLLPLVHFLKLGRKWKWIVGMCCTYLILFFLTPFGFGLVIASRM